MYLERALFICAPRDSGKSTQLRSIFKDKRLGMNGVVPNSSQYRKLKDSYCLSNERSLLLRLTSPHENGESPSRFHKKVHDKTDKGRWCFASALQPSAHNKMPDIVEAVKLFLDEFDPERLRVVFLSPTRHGIELNDYSNGRNLVDEILALRNTEVLQVDARQREVNGLFYADFFDFS